MTSYFCLGVGLKSTIWPNLTNYAGEIFWNMNKKNHSNNKVAELIGQMANFKCSEVFFLSNILLLTQDQELGGKLLMIQMNM